LAPTTPGLLRSFSGLTDTGWFPPDPIMTAGPNHVVVATNSSWAIYSKTGSLLYQTTFDNWFAKQGPPSFIFDPKVGYDPSAGRWILFALARDTDAQRSYYLISVSDDSDPIGNWASWKLDAGMDGSTQSYFW